ncbi:hypothetical protein ASC95_07980 [Pelomonas sp. Root1217]|uniref:DUF1801 domain-containing protein n=1 Tax=Pelomonas sp. Root1217 TaxID=1736430 RepID=UPI00070D4E22|nr:DUF1801 domain-containing protein [Pelomonas sp. Root1217]KQV52749.1 hypothetical protein ASC95_07980 [Pelomonas sp. Root1217]
MPKLATADTTAAVDQFMAALDHPFKAEIEALRRAMRAVDPSIAEGIKWNAPSWRTSDYFATTHLRSKAGLGLILHLGAKARELPEGGLQIADPTGLLKWLGKDRAQVEFTSAADFMAKLPALQAVLKGWIRHV